MTDFTLPELGEDIASGDVLRVLVKPGDTIAKDQSVLELETDKATIEVPSSVAGQVKDVKVKAGDKVKVGQAILSVDEAGGASAEARPRCAAESAGQRPACASASPASPACSPPPREAPSRGRRWPEPPRAGARRSRLTSAAVRARRRKRLRRPRCRRPRRRPRYAAWRASWASTSTTCPAEGRADAFPSRT